MLHWIGLLIVAYLTADLIAGFWHWLEDRYFDVRWPLVGEYIAKPNELHHTQPQAFVAQSYWSRNWTTITPASVVFLLALFSGSIFWMAVAAFASQANEIHAWAHSKGKLPQWIVMLQATGLLQSPAHHAEHHRSPFAIRYCVMSDWLNPMLDYFQVWRSLEGLLEIAFGLRVKPDA